MANTKYFDMGRANTGMSWIVVDSISDEDCERFRKLWKEQVERATRAWRVEVIPNYYDWKIPAKRCFKRFRLIRCAMD